jgi:hypothetical protein
MLIRKVAAMKRFIKRKYRSEYRGLPWHFDLEQGIGVNRVKIIETIGRRGLYCLLISILLLFLISCVPQQKQWAATDNFSDSERAQYFLLDFLENLHNGNYDEVAHFYGGSYQTMIDQNPDIDPDDHQALLRNACNLNGMQCLRAKIIGLEQEISGEKYVFIVEFLKHNGTLFTFRPCCGEDEGSFPQQSIFLFTVVNADQNSFTVMDLPPYAP